MVNNKSLFLWGPSEFEFSQNMEYHLAVCGKRALTKLQQNGSEEVPSPLRYVLVLSSLHPLDL